MNTTNGTLESLHEMVQKVIEEKAQLEQKASEERERLDRRFAEIQDSISGISYGTYRLNAMLQQVKPVDTALPEITIDPVLSKKAKEWEARQATPSKGIPEWSVKWLWAAAIVVAVFALFSIFGKPTTPNQHRAEPFAFVQDNNDQTKEVLTDLVKEMGALSEGMNKLKEEVQATKTVVLPTPDPVKESALPITPPALPVTVQPVTVPPVSSTLVMGQPVVTSRVIYESPVVSQPVHSDVICFPDGTCVPQPMPSSLPTYDLQPRRQTVFPRVLWR